MIFNRANAKRTQINRRAFLRGASGIALGLPFLESLPERSAWAQNDAPVFGFFIISACGVEQNTFWPTDYGPLSEANLTGSAMENLVDYADKLLIVDGVKYPGRMVSCGHAEGLCQSLTGVGQASNGRGAQSSGTSADIVISNALNPQGTDPLSLYSGMGYYIAERISFSGGGTARPMQLNPYAAYQSLVGVVDTSAADQQPGTTPAATAEPTAEAASTVDELMLRRKSVNDVVRDDFNELLSVGRLGSADRARMEQHLNAVRELEVNMMNTGSDMIQMAADDPAIVCAMGNLDQTGIEAFKNGIKFSQQGNMIEDVVKLHAEVVALSFACNQNRVAALQWGDGTDGTRYAGLQSSITWPFHQISHRVQSDGALGNNHDAELAHAEIDRIRMETLGHVIQVFEERNLLNQSFVYFTSHVAAGDHSFNNLPIIIAGSGGHYLKQGEYIEGSGTNAGVLAALVKATGAADSFASEQPLDALLA